ncbi:putative zinc-ribbon domain plant [Arabidopsis thaliana x Arabidopsis arenosa]|uniref:Putative zinc-ribbon domain plant n=1 Tax=Arabidopsis thaliana x Arabidopsis arenosa TaxID=1240361 RepID=A0A8T1Z4P5_9BRAS|nr:putative zinc-ribbon domain plant [Arabidopsis thaliana x Arabidopsis arenosa]
MRSPGDVSEADGTRSDAGSSRSEEETNLKEKHSNSRAGSQRSGKSLRNEELGEPNYGSDSSSKNTSSSNPIEYTEQERAELLRRLDSIKDHLLRGGGNNVVDKPKEPDHNQPFLRPIHLHGHPNHNPGPSYYHPYPEPVPYPGPVHGMYPQAYQDPYGFQIHRRPPPVPNPNWYPPGHYPNQMARQFPGGQYVEIGPDIVDPHSYFPATPGRYSDLPPYSPVSSHHRGEKLATQYSDMPPYSPVSSHHRGEKLTTPYSSRVDNSSSFPSSMGSPGPRGGYARWPSEHDSEMGGAFARGYVKKAVSDTDARRCHPLAGGAPFIACHSCFELLYLPKKKLLAQERQHKLQCGACSEVINFTIVDRKLVFSSGIEETKPVSLKVEDRSTTNTVVVEELSSVDFNNSGSDIPPKDEEEPVQEFRSHQDTMQSIRSESQNSDDEERSSISSEQQQKEVKSVRRRGKGSKAPEPAAPDNASLLELFEYSNVNRAALAYGMAQLGYDKPDKQKSFMTQDSLQPESVATETEVSYNGYSNTEISEESRYSNGREDDNRPRARKGSEYGSTEITTRSSTDRNEDQMKSLEVWVNGHLIPEDLVSSAEKLAGPIQAGKYWYDYRAGFWGVMGKPCLGIVPPFIEEFSHPMPDNCAAGNTEVFVNGRELHKRDFELLVGRGLPRDKNRSYIVDISGRILDGDSGEELHTLGKLAPTIEKVKHGFGMRVPRSLAS